ncbi:leucyl aminopeptidase [Pseudolysinimonas sp.]|uniref:leucyl aminopeptidase n=1 Tax=Pseudolysinimonas sp. TaxID=2680009 RepID=UPI003F7F1614
MSSSSTAGSSSRSSSLPSSTFELHLADERPAAAGGDVLVLFVRAGKDGPELLGHDGHRELLGQLKVTGAPDQLVRVPSGVVDELPVALVGLGSDVTASALRAAAGTAARLSAGDRRLIIEAPDVGSGAQDETASAADGTGEADRRLAALLEGAALGGYVYEGRPRGDDDRSPASKIVVVGSSQASEALVERATVLAQSVHLTRELVNTPPSAQSPDALAQAAVEAACGLPIEVRVWTETELADDGFGGILGVGSGSTRPPRLVRLDYAPDAAAGHIAFVGKGITFDTGGLSLKPPTSMVGMKYDMAGAASVLAVVIAAARLRLPVRVTGWMCIAENMPSGSAIRPNDVLTIRGGTRVEVLNTDAEGRLVLADGLRAATEEHPDAVVDIATLTGAQMVALGTRYSAAMGDDGLVKQVTDAAERAGELVWPMPLPSELRARLRSEVADLTNATPGNTAAGMLLAGVFLREFVGRSSDEPDAATVPWAHLDIAGSAQNDGAPYGYTPKGGTGVLVRTLITLTEEFSAR